MRHKHALSIALAGFAATIALGVGMAGADPVTGLGDGTAVTTPATDGAPTPPPAPQLPECGDGVDNDGDGSVDLDDPECQVEGSAGEAPATEEPEEQTSAEEPSGKGEIVGGTGIGGNQPAPESKRKPRVVQHESIGNSGPETGGVGSPQKVKEGDELKPPPGFTDGGSPTRANPSATIAPFGPAPIGVPNVVIDSFEIPPFLLPIYQACGTQYGIPWNVLASINKIETAFGTNLNVSSAGAMGWMQFIPSSWEAYGVDANGDGRKDPYNPVDAICAAARYLEAAGGTEDLYDAIFAYNHADWYVQEVLLYARAYGKLPTDLIGSLTGLTEGAHFPVAADARYADDISIREALKNSTPNDRRAYGNAAEVISSSPTRRGINIFSRKGAPVVAVNDGVIKRLGRSKKLGRYIVLQDAYGNRYIYAKLGRIARTHPVPKPRKLTAEDFELVSPKSEEPEGPATVATREDEDAQGGKAKSKRGKRRFPKFETFEKAFNSIFAFDSKTTERRPLKVGSKVVGGTVIARMGGSVDGVDPYINFSIRPAGRGAPKIDPKPILDGWKLLEATAIYRAVGKNPFRTDIGVGGVLLMSKQALIRRVLADPRLEIYSCGRTDIRNGGIDRRVLATLEYLAEQGFRLTVTSLTCGHGFYTASGNVSNHSSGNAVDIAAINGVPILGNQGPGTLTEAVLKSVLRLQGTMTPEELISLHEMGGPSFAMGDHADHIHIGWQPLYANGRLSKRFVQLLKPRQWERLIDRLGEIDNPEVPLRPSKASLPAGGGKHGSQAHSGE